MRFRIRRSLLAASIGILASAHSARAGAAGFIVQGYWKWSENPGAEFARYLRITGDSGYSCFLDGKSGFAFAIAKDSMTTPMNGKNGVVWMPGSGDIVITGMEKGVPYTERYHPGDSADYWAHCRDQDKPPGTTGLRDGAGRRAYAAKSGGPVISRWLREGYTVLGRKAKALPLL